MVSKVGGSRSTSIFTFAAALGVIKLAISSAIDRIVHRFGEPRGPLVGVRVIVVRRYLWSKVDLNPLRIDRTVRWFEGACEPLVGVCDIVRWRYSGSKVDLDPLRALFLFDMTLIYMAV